MKCMPWIAGLVLVGIGLWASGCATPAFAPPVRFGPGHLPDPMGPEEGWAQVGLGPYPDLRGEFSVAEDLVLQTGYSGTIASPPEMANHLGSVGLRYQLQEGMFPASISGGVGAGKGGNNPGSGTRTLGEIEQGARSPGDDYYFTGGGYTGVEIGMRLTDWFGTYSDSSVMLSGSPDLPTTFWASQRLGLQFGGEDLHFSMEAGVAYLTNEVDAFILPILGLAMGGGWGETKGD